MIKKKTGRKILETGFKDYLRNLEFKKVRYKYVARSNDVYNYFSFSVFDYYHVFPSQFYYGMGFFSVKRLLQKIVGGAYHNPENDFPPIIGIGQADLFESGDYHTVEYEITNEKEAMVMVAEVMNYLEKDAFRICVASVLLRKWNQ